MKNKEIVTKLKKYKDNPIAKINFNLEKYSLTEICYHNGKWNGYPYTCTTYTNWKRSTIEIDYFELDELIKLLKKKNLNEMDSDDFSNMSIQESTDGSVDVEELEWSDETPTEEELENLDKKDLYWDSDITDSECEFASGSIWFMEIEVEGEKFNIEN